MRSDDVGSRNRVDVEGADRRTLVLLELEEGERQREDILLVLLLSDLYL